MSPESILRKVNLRITSSRIDVLDFFIQHVKLGVSIVDLQHNFKQKYDKVTLYRTIATFEEKGLVHKILDESTLDKYALCGEDCSSKQHQHEHIHFYCLKCGTSECLNEHIELQIKLPKNYSKTHSNFLISGICGKCQEKS
jgi:Fur family ferric uptake transcriptional regulator